MATLNLDQARWIEIQFWFIINDILNLKGDLMAIFTTIEYLVIIKPYDIESVKHLAMTMINNPHSKPLKIEIVSLGHKFKAPIKQIKKRTKANNKKLYTRIAKNNADPAQFYPKFGVTDIEHMLDFIDAFTCYQNLGIYGRGQLHANLYN